MPHMPQENSLSHIKIDLKNGFLEIEGSSSLVESVIPLIRQMGDILKEHNQNGIQKAQVKENEEKLNSLESDIKGQMGRNPSFVEQNRDIKESIPAFYDSELSNTEIYYTGILQFLLIDLTPQEKQNDLTLLLTYFLMLIDPKRSFTEVDLNKLASRVGVNFNFSEDLIQKLKKKKLIIDDEIGGFELSIEGEGLVSTTYGSRINSATKIMKERSHLDFT